MESPPPQSEPLLPPRPQSPHDSDCCGSGCTPCVFDLYNSELKLWQKECERIHTGNDKSGEASFSNGPVISTDEYREYQLLSITPETADTYNYRFKLPNNHKLPLSAGQHLVLRCMAGNRAVIRQYTPVSDPSTRGCFDVVIKLYEEGEMSECVRQLDVGQHIQWRGPIGAFTYSPNTYSRLVLLAAGTGIAPMIQVIRQVLSDDDDYTRLQLMYCCKTYSDILCKSSLDEWASYWNFTVVYYLSQGIGTGNTSIQYGDKVVTSRLTQEAVVSEITEDLDGLKILICGTKSFDKDMVNYIKSLDLPQESYHIF